VTDLPDLDIAAALMRRSQGDMNAFMAAFAARMSGAFPGSVTVDRRKGLFSRTETVRAVSCNAGSHVYTLSLADGRLTATREQTIRGVRLRSETMDPAAWFAALNVDLSAMASQTGDAHALLHDFLMS
jgi:hypothetical protein